MRNFKAIFSAILIFVLTSLEGCFIVKSPESDVGTLISVSFPKPTIEMSETMARSKIGDMIAFLPKDWFFVDLEGKAPADVFAVAVNPDYTLALVFSKLPASPEIKSKVEEDGLIGLARASLELKKRKTAGAVKLAGKFRPVNLGSLSFCQYKYKIPSYPLAVRSAVFVSSLGNYYEISLMPLSVNLKPRPSPKEADETFNSTLATAQY